MQSQIIQDQTQLFSGPQVAASALGNPGIGSSNNMSVTPYMGMSGQKMVNQSAKIAKLPNGNRFTQMSIGTNRQVPTAMITNGSTKSVATVDRNLQQGGRFTQVVKSFLTPAPNSHAIGIPQQPSTGGFVTSGQPMGFQTSYRPSHAGRTSTIVMGGKGELTQYRQQVDQAKNSKRITGAMRLVAAAKVRRAQNAVLAGRPFSETLASVLYKIREGSGADFSDSPFTEDRPVKTVGLVVISGERGLCGSYNSAIIRLAEERCKQIKDQGVDVKLIFAGKKASDYFKKRKDQYDLGSTYTFGNTITAKDAQDISQEITNMFLTREVDKIELIYTNFESLVSNVPRARSVLPLVPTGLESETDEIFKLSSKDGKFSVDVMQTEVEKKELSSDTIFEQAPNQILSALIPLFISSQILRALQESQASELASRMIAMKAATDNASALIEELTGKLNRARQALVTQELSEIVAGAEASGN